MRFRRGCTLLGVVDEVRSHFELRGAIVVLRDLVSVDREAFANWAGDEAMYQFMAWRLVDREAANEEFERLTRHPERTNPQRRHWYLALTTTRGDFCGLTAFDWRADGFGELGWYLSSDHWGRGYATSATSMLLQFAFDELHLPAVTATCDPDNLASRRVLEKCGMRHIADETIETWHGVRPRLRFQITAGDFAHGSIAT